MDQRKERHNKSIWTLAIGVGSILALMVGLFYLAVSHTTFMHETQNKLLVIKEKTELALIMRETIRKRSFSMALAQTMTDPFDRDDERTRFQGYARDFVVAREKLFALGVGPEEREILNVFQQHVLAGRPLVDDAMDIIIDDATGPEVTEKMLKAVESQTVQFYDLDHFVDFQKQQEKTQIAVTTEESEQARRALMVLGTVAFVAGIVIAFLVVRRERWHRNILLEEISDRIQAQQITRDLNATLEERVEKRTHALSEEIAVRRRAEELAERASQAKTHFLSSMSHELRTPLNAIIGFGQIVQMQASSKLDAKNQEYIHYIISSGEHLLRLIKDVLELNKIEEGRLSLHFEAVSMRQLIDDCLKLVAERAKEMNVSLIDQTQGADLPMLWSDSTRLKQVLLNLLGNAVKYNKDGGSVTVSFDAMGSDSFRLAVADTGDGIPQEKQANLFVPFDRLGREAGTIEGTGVGLTITKRIAELLGGSIGFKSHPGAGSTFWMVVPHTPPQNLPDLADINEASQPTADDVHKRMVGTKSILYVEDNDANMLLMKAVLGMFDGIDMVGAKTAEDGLDLAFANQPDLILMDINLPGMSGFEALKILQESNETSAIPVIAVSADAMPKDIEFAITAGFDSYIAKPINVVQVQQKILTVLQRDDSV